MADPFITARAKGLYTHPNPIGASIPLGAFTKADDVVIDREDIVETRRGMKLQGTTLSDQIKKLFNYRNRKFASHGSKIAYDSDGSETWIDFAGTFAAPSGATRIRAAQANKNLYLTTSAGIKKKATLTDEPVSAGIPKGLDGSGATTGAAGWMANNVQAAYRVVWGIIDANANKILGAPSQRIVVSNSSGGTRNVIVTFTIPAGITTSHFYQIYRSAVSIDLATEPNDEMQLIVEKNPTAGEIVALSVSYTDQTADSLRGASLYTNPSQQGIAQANDTPPIATDIAVYKNQMLFGNVIGKHRMYVTLISVGGSGLVVDDTVTIAGVLYTAKGAENAAAGQFLCSTGGTASQNIDTTARSLVKVINQYASNTLVYAYYITGFNELPGQILIEERGLGGSAFVAISSRGGAFSPELPGSGTTYSSANDTAPNRIFVAKAGQPEAVPLLNYVDVGSALANLRRIMPTRGAVYVLKDDGVFRITGETLADFRVDEFDGTTTITAEESAVTFNNSVVCFADQGIVRISDSGVEIISRPIERSLLELMIQSNFNEVCFGVSYESDRKFILGIQTSESDTTATQQFVYNALTNSWTRWSRNATCGIVGDADDKLYFGSGTVNRVNQERKDYMSTDYADEEIDVTISSINGLFITLTSVTGLVVGDSLAQLSGTTVIRDTIITAINTGTNIITVTDVLSWDGGAAKVYRPISSAVRWAPIYGVNPTVAKQFAWLAFLFAGSDFDTLTATITSDLDLATDEISLTPKDAQPWGYGDWGGGGLIGFGGGPIDLQMIPTTLPKEKQICNWVIVELAGSQALKSFASAGVAAYAENVQMVPAQR